MPLIEKGITSGLEIENLLHLFIDPMLDTQIDTLVLGCTHYTFLIPALKKMLPNSIQIIDGRDAVARQTQFILEKNKILASKEQQKSTVYYTTGNPKELQKFVSEDGCIEKVSITL